MTIPVTSVSTVSCPVLSCPGHAHPSAVSTARDVVGHRDTGECAGWHHGVVPRGGDRTPLTWMSLRLELPKSFPTVMSCFARCCGPPSIRMEGRVAERWSSSEGSRRTRTLPGIRLRPRHARRFDVLR